jgi:hypothetical protein
MKKLFEVYEHENIIKPSESNLLVFIKAFNRKDYAKYSGVVR